MKNKTRITSIILTILIVITLIPDVSAMASNGTNLDLFKDVFSISNKSQIYHQMTLSSDICGWNQMKSTTDVIYQGQKVGTVYAGEGVTVISCSLNEALIEYSGSNKAKVGSVPLSSLKYKGCYPNTDIGVVLNNCTTYYTPGTFDSASGTHVAGSLSAGETVAILAEINGWYYVEYNISGGMRKRAYVNFHYVGAKTGYSEKIPYHYGDKISLTITQSYTVYAGPNPASYPNIGSIDSRDNGKVFGYKTFQDANGNRMYYISYPTTNGVKYGYIRY